MKCKMWQPQLPVLFVVKLLLLCIVFPLLTGTSMNSVCSTREPTALQVMAVIPIAHYGSDNLQLLPDWKRGEEILPGAHLAIKEINDLPDLLCGYRLEVIPIRVPQCDLNEGIVPFVRELTSNDNNVIGIVGYFCHNIALELSQLAHSEVLSTLQILATSLTDNHNVYRASRDHRLHNILPLSESTATAMVQLMQMLEWNKIAVICNHDLNFVDSKHAFFKAAQEHGIQIATQIETFHSPLQELQTLGVKIIVAFVSQSEAVDILCSAYSQGFKWPDYVWIFTEISKPETFKDHCQVDAINNAIFLHLTYAKQEILPSGLNYSAYYDAYLEELEKSSAQLNISLERNSYANVLYDSIWAFALTINTSLCVLNERNLSLTNTNQDTRNEITDVLEEQLSQLSFRGTTGWLNFSHSAAAVQTSVELFQFQNGQSVQIGWYNYSLNQLYLNRSALGVVPSDALDRMYVIYPIALTVILSFLIILCFGLTTVSMCLFIYYRNEPSIKATSNTLSLCMFIGCYFLLTSSLFHSITSATIIYERQESLRTFICMFDIFIMMVGVDIVFAIVIAKTLRIYHIFKTFGKVSRVCSNQGLFILILGIISVKVVMLTVWVCLDPARVVDTEQFVSQDVPPFFRVVQECQTDHYNIGIWLTLAFGYSTILALVMVLLAVLTRKIKRSDYKDSKKINILVSALILNMCICVPLWIIFRNAASPILSRLAYNVATMIAAVLCQVLLILPKTVPLIVRNSAGINLDTWRELTRSKAHSSN